MLKKDINIEKIIDPKRWKFFNKISNNQQLVFELGHLNPEVFMDFEKAERNKIIKQEKRNNTIETTSTYGIITKKGRRSDFYEAMIVAIQMGLISGITIQDVQDLRNKTNKIFPEEYDYQTNISVVDYRQEKLASQALENLASQFSKGLADTSIPGAPDNMTIKEAFSNPSIVAEMKKQGKSIDEINKLLEKIKEASTQMIKNTQEANIKYEVGKFNQYPAVYFLTPPKPKVIKKEKKKDRIIEIKNPDGTITKIQASGGFDDRVKFPSDAFEKEDYPIDDKILQAIQVNSFLISGNLLTSLHCMPSGKLFCQSLKEFKTITKVTHDEGTTFIDHLIVPLNSCLEKEGYMNREEIEKMVLDFISLLQ